MSAPAPLIVAHCSSISNSIKGKLSCKVCNSDSTLNSLLLAKLSVPIHNGIPLCTSTEITGRGFPIKTFAFGQIQKCNFENADCDNCFKNVISAVVVKQL